MAVEYRVREITRYTVTRFEEGVGSRQIGEYPNADTAQSVGYAMCEQERVAAGAPIDSMEFVFPGTVAGG